MRKPRADGATLPGTQEARQPHYAGLPSHGIQVAEGRRRHEYEFEAWCARDLFRHCRRFDVSRELSVPHLMFLEACVKRDTLASAKLSSLLYSNCRVVFQEPLN